MASRTDPSLLLLILRPRVNRWDRPTAKLPFSRTQSIMRRVSSRQRLVSWDAFDATNSDDGELSDLSEHDSEAAAGAALGTAPAVVAGTEEPLTSRKRSRHRSEPPPHIIPSFSWEVETTLATLCQDVQFTLFSYLDESSLRRLASTNCSFRSLILLTPGTKEVIWMPHLRHHWPMEVTEKTFSMMEDRMGIPTAAAAGMESSHALNTPNLPLLLSMTPSTLPTQVDISLLDHANSSTPPATRNTIFHLMQAQTSTSTHLKVVEGTNDVIMYTGPIGRGDRCVRANHPLPRPTSVRHGCGSSSMSWKGVPTTTSLLHSYRAHPAPAPGVHSVPGSLLSLLRQGARNIRGGKEQWRPFCSPYYQQNGRLNVTPRMVAYYEVDILESKTPVEQPVQGVFHDEDAPRTTTPSECVAVGIATEAFRIHSRMPGWDSQSFGYHGDDGGTFHASGGMNAQFGPTFGAGDTVGCGIDYIARGIFFTLNGRFLGYGWKNLQPEMLFNQDLYPVVGVDTNAAIRLNFGISKPFLYDLDEFHASHERFIQPHYRFSVPVLGHTAKRPITNFMRRQTSQKSLASNASTSNGSGSRHPRRRSTSIK